MSKVYDFLLVAVPTTALAVVVAATVVFVQAQMIIELPVQQASSTPAFLLDAPVGDQENYEQNNRIIYELKQINVQLSAIRKKL